MHFSVTEDSRNLNAMWCACCKLLLNCQQDDAKKLLNMQSYNFFPFTFSSNRLWVWVVCVSACISLRLCTVCTCRMEMGVGGQHWEHRFFLMKKNSAGRKENIPKTFYLINDRGFHLDYVRFPSASTGFWILLFSWGRLWNTICLLISNPCFSRS